MLVSIVERFEKHRIHSTLQLIEEIIKRAKSMSNLSPEQLDNIQRFNQIKIQAKLILDSVDPCLVSLNNLNSLDNLLLTAKNNLEAFINNRNINNYNTMVSNLESAISQLSLIQNIKTPDDVGNLREDISAFRKSIGQYRRSIEDNYKKYIDKMEEKYKKVDNDRQSLERDINDLKASIDIEKKRIDQIISQVQNQISEFQSQFSESQEKRRESFSVFIGQLENKADGVIDNIKEKYVNLTEELKNKQKEFEEKSEMRVYEYFNIFEKYKKDVEKIAGAIAVTGMAHGYKKIADSERKAKIIWQVVTVISILGLIGFGIYFVNSFKPLDMSETEINWASFLARFIVVSAIGTLTAYAAKQASKHMESERHNRKMELELASIDPFLAVLPEKNIYKVKEELAAQLFGRRDELALDDKEEDTELATNMIIRIIEKVYYKLIKH